MSLDLYINKHYYIDSIHIYILNICIATMAMPLETDIFNPTGITF